MVRISTRILVTVSNLVSRWWPPTFERYTDDLAYSQWQMRNAERSYELFREIRPFKGERILDLGCGEGGKTTFYAGKEPSIIVGIDIGARKIARAKRFSSQDAPKGRAHFLVASAHHQPFTEGSFDIVISEDCFDHYQEPSAVLREAKRTLRRGGVFLVRFDTYYNWGGSHLYNFIRLPWAHLIFSDEALVEATRAIAAQLESRDPGGERRESYREQAEREIHQFRHFVNRITLSKWRKLVREQGWKMVLEETQSSGRKIPLLRLPLVEELYNSLFYVLEKG